MLEVDEESRLGREVLAGGARYHAGLVPEDDAIARMYERATEWLAAAGLRQYEISNFCREGFESRHNLRYWERRPYLGVGLDASSALRAAAPTQGGVGRDEPRDVLRATTADELGAYLDGTGSPRTGLRPWGGETGSPRTGLRPWGGETGSAETAWLSADRQHEEAWFLGLRLNTGVDGTEVAREFGAERAARAREVVERLEGDGLVTREGERVRLTARGRMVSNDVFQEFIGTCDAAGVCGGADARSSLA
jgi:oxygen-independent coproporphyrinogen-3 oxidase